MWSSSKKRKGAKPLLSQPTEEINMELSFMASEEGDLETAYIKVRDGVSVVSKEIKDGEIVLDFDEKNTLLGIEVIDIHHGTADLIRGLATQYEIPGLGKYLDKHAESFA